MTHNLKIIHIEDIPSDAELVERTLKKSEITFEKVTVDTKTQYIKALEEFHPDVILSDHSLPSFNSLEALQILKQSGIDIPFILITSTVSEEFAVSVMKEGASDYVLKDRLQRLPNAIINAIEKFQSESEIQKNIEELKAASERQSTILNALPANIVLLNQAGKIVAVNESWRKFTLANNLGVPKYGIDYSYTAISEKATGVDELSGKKIAEGIKEVIAGTKTEFSLEYSFYSQQKKVWFQIIVAPLTDKSKKGAVVLHFDITARKLAEELRLQSEANLQTIFENTDMAFVLCDTEKKIVSFNSKANELCLEQFNKKLKVGGYVFTYFPKSKIPNVKEAIQKVLHNEKFGYETSYDLKDGSVKWFDVRWEGIANEQKVNTGFILAFKDITARKTSDLERDRMTTDLVQRYKELEQFTYIVSHNLRAPVANIMGLSDLLNSFDFNLSESKDVLKALETSISVLDQTIMDLNHILQVRSDVNEQSEIVSFQFLVNDIILSLENLIQKEHVTINTNFIAVENIIIVKSYMYSIFYNLILNGIKYRRPGVDPVISIFTIKKDEKLEILFKDNGTGIEEKNIKNLFGLYRRFDANVEGKGMGLFIVKMQAENLGGKISVQSEPGLGTTFKLTFPKVKYS
ncbi:MAG TPA: PAS domain S-box protein [Mucilaginibacter sp.]|jgi:PAS domain S-box-containing protein